MPSTQIAFALAVAAATTVAGAWLAASGLADWGLFATGALLGAIAVDGWRREAAVRRAVAAPVIATRRAARA